jgi:hypothetical protein
MFHSLLQPLFLTGSLGVLVGVFLLLAIVVYLYDRHRHKLKLQRLLSAGASPSQASALSRLDSTLCMEQLALSKVEIELKEGKA